MPSSREKKRQNIRKQAILAEYRHWHQYIGEPLEKVPMPEALKKYDKWNGYVIFETVFRGKDGTPDFRVMDEVAKQRCVQRRACIMCAEPLEEVVCLIGGNRSCEHGQFIDPAVHPDCAYYAALTCPFLAGIYRTMHEIDSVKEKHEEHAVVQIHDQKKPDKMGILFTSDQNQLWLSDGNSIVEPVDRLAIDYEIMPRTQKRGKAKAPFS